MRSNRLRMNADKTQLVLLGTRQQLAKLTTTELPLLSVLVKPLSAVIDLGVNIVGQLTMGATTSPRYAGRAYASFGWSELH